MMNGLKLALCAVLGLSADYAIAKAKLHVSTSYMKQQSEVLGASSDSKTTIYNITLGGDFDKNAFVGFKHFLHVVDSGTEISASGLSAGYLDKSGFMIIASWMINPEKTYRLNNDDVVLKSKVGSELKGTIIDIGYMLKAGSYYVGPQVTYSKFEYDSIDGSSEDDSTEIEDTSDTFIFPYLSVLVEL